MASNRYYCSNQFIYVLFQSTIQVLILGFISGRINHFYKHQGGRKPFISASFSLSWTAVLGSSFKKIRKYDILKGKYSSRIRTVIWNKRLFFYMVDVVQNVRYLYCQLRVSCVLLTTTISQSRLSLLASPATLSKLKNLVRLQVKMTVSWPMRPLTGTRKSLQVLSMKKVQ